MNLWGAERGGLFHLFHLVYKFPWLFCLAWCLACVWVLFVCLVLFSLFSFFRANLFSISTNSSCWPTMSRTSPAMQEKKTSQRQIHFLCSPAHDHVSRAFWGSCPPFLWYTLWGEREFVFLQHLDVSTLHNMAGRNTQGLTCRCSPRALWGNLDIRSIVFILVRCWASYIAYFGDAFSGIPTMGIFWKIGFGKRKFSADWFSGREVFGIWEALEMLRGAWSEWREFVLVSRA